MSGHDPLCLTNGPGPRDLCDCGTIRLVRADERERIALAIEAQCESDEPPCLGCFTAARIARNGGRDE